MDKFIRLSEILCKKETGHIYFECPACGVPHGLRIVPTGYVKKDPNEQVWTWNGDVNLPTFSPSVDVKWKYSSTGKENRCHSFVENGYIRFLSDCTHSMKDQTVLIPKWDTALE